MKTPTDADTRSPWYECFENETLPPLTPEVAALLADLLAEAGGSEDDADNACAEALFDYYNA